MEFPFLFVPTQVTASRQHNLFAKAGKISALKILVVHYNNYDPDQN
jgi:hypothetical protein